MNGISRPGRRRSKTFAPPLCEMTAEPLEPPDHLDDVAKQVWRELAPDLHARQQLSPLDETAFAIYCSQISTYRHAQAIIDREGTTFTTKRGIVKVHPAVKLASTAADRAIEIGKCFGLTPSSRARLGEPMKSATSSKAARFFSD